MKLIPIANHPPTGGSDLEFFLHRKIFTANATTGYITLDGQPMFWTLERPWENGANRRDDKTTAKINESTCILTGRYELVPHVWSLTGKFVPMLKNVQGRDGILMHTANYPSQLLGCIAVGFSMASESVLSSKDANEALMRLIKPVWDAGHKAWLTISNEPQATNKIA